MFCQFENMYQPEMRLLYGDSCILIPRQSRWLTERVRQPHVPPAMSIHASDL